jgi:hypothetical protein
MNCAGVVGLCGWHRIRVSGDMGMCGDYIQILIVESVSALSHKGYGLAGVRVGALQ